MNKDKIYVEYINKIGKKYAIDIIIPLDIMATVFIAKNRDNIAIPSLSVSSSDIIQQLHNKWELTKILDDLAISYPKTVIINNKKNIIEGIMEYPFLIKPTDQEACRGIVKINNSADLQKYRKTHAVYEKFPILAQQYVDGSDIDISLLAFEGNIVSWTIQKWEKSGILEFVDNYAVHDIGKKIIARKKYSGFAHIDLRINKKTGEVLVLECNPRAWGTINASILAGVDFIRDVFDCVSHKPIANQMASKKTYMTFSALLKTLFTRPWELLNMSSVSMRDFLLVITDPVPYIFLGWKALRRR